MDRENKGKVIVAIKNVIEATFDDARWRELGYATNTVNIIEEHPRLLRSLHWGDSDYGSCILQILPQVLGKSMENIEAVGALVGLESWLRKHDPKLNAELYGAEVVPLEVIEKASEIHDVLELNQEIARIRQSVTGDPALAVGSAKELLETVLRTILAAYGYQAGQDDVPALLKKSQQILGIEPNNADKSSKEGMIRYRTLSNLGLVVIGVAELRNILGTGHGRSRGPQADIVHARLVVNAAATIASYLLEIWEMKKEVYAGRETVKATFENTIL